MRINLCELETPHENPDNPPTMQPTSGMSFCNVWSHLGLGIEQYRPRGTVSAPASPTQHCPLSHATRPHFPLPPHSPALTRVLSPPSLCICHLPPQIVIGSTPSPSQSSCSSHRAPNPLAQAQASPPLHRPTSKTQDTAALRSTHHALPLDIAPRGLDLVSV